MRLDTLLLTLPLLFLSSTAAPTDDIASCTQGLSEYRDQLKALATAPEHPVTDEDVLREIANVTEMPEDEFRAQATEICSRDASPRAANAPPPSLLVSLQHILGNLGTGITAPEPAQG